MRAGVTWGNAALGKDEFPIQHIGRNLQSCLKYRKPYYPFTKMHQLVAFALRIIPFSAKQQTNPIN